MRVRRGEAIMTGRTFASALASFAEEWVGGDIRALHALATTLYGYLPRIAGVTTALNQEVAQLTGGDHGWRGPAASAFTAAWRRDAAAADTLAVAIAQTAAVVDGLAVRLATIEKALEEQAYTAARYGVTIGAGGRPPPVPGGPPAGAAAASERHWARAYRQAYEQALADARQARQQAAITLRSLYAAIETAEGVAGIDGVEGIEGVEGTVPSFPPGLLPVPYPRPDVEPGLQKGRIQGVWGGGRCVVGSRVPWRRSACSQRPDWPCPPGRPGPGPRGPRGPG
jgi:hypothetical protein